MRKFNPLFCVKSSLISLYLALTIPIPFTASQELKLVSIVAFVLGLFLIINITSDYVETCDNKISYKTNFLSNIFGKKSWQIYWKNIKQIKSLSTSQGSKVFYFITVNNESFLVPQRVENFDELKLIISDKTSINAESLSYISPLWTYKLLTFLSLVMIFGEFVAFYN